MPDRFAQDAPPFTIDLSGLWQGLIDNMGPIGTAIWTGISNNLGLIGSTLWSALSNALYGAVRSLFLTIWQAALLDIPRGMTDQFPPVAALLVAGTQVAVAGLVLALTLLGLRTYIRGITGRGGILDEILGRVIVYVGIVSMLPWIIARALDVESAGAKSVALVDLAAILPAQIVPNDPISFTFSLAIMLLLGIRLWFKLAANVVHVAVAIAWSPIAMICGLMPQTAWVTSLWTREFAGRLAGAVLATAATGIGLGLAMLNAGVLAFVGVGAAFLAAHDLVDWLARTPGSSMSGVVGTGLRMGVGLIGGGGGGAVSAGAQAAAMRSYQATQAAKATQAFYSFD